jgi:hypothetical protein
MSNKWGHFRSARHGDLDFASKWNALSFYENDARRVEHHLETLDAIEAARVQALDEADAEKAQRLLEVSFYWALLSSSSVFHRR